MIRKFAPVLVIAICASLGVAEDAAKDAAATCDSKACAAKTCTAENGECKTCPIEAAMTKLPKMTFLVGKEETCCSESAAKMAQEHDQPMKFVVAKQTYTSESDAMVALAKETEQFVSDFVTPHKCDVSGKFTVAAKELCCETMAGERAAIAKKAMEDITMTYLVGTHECSCPDEAAQLAKKNGGEKLFVIAGEKTCCSVDARVRLAQAKYKAAVTALAKADSDEATPQL